MEMEDDKSLKYLYPNSVLESIMEYSHLRRNLINKVRLGESISNSWLSIGYINVPDLIPTIIDLLHKIRTIDWSEKAMLLKCNLITIKKASLNKDVGIPFSMLSKMDFYKCFPITQASPPLNSQKFMVMDLDTNNEELLLPIQRFCDKYGHQYKMITTNHGSSTGIKKKVIVAGLYLNIDTFHDWYVLNETPISSVIPSISTEINIEHLLNVVKDILSTIRL